VTRSTQAQGSRLDSGSRLKAQVRLKAQGSRLKQDLSDPIRPA
jgi:hypothetical protein